MMAMDEKMSTLEKFARAYDREDASQRGEPDPWKDAEDDATWVSERLACAAAALSSVHPVPGEPTHKHLKSGHLVRVIGTGRMQSTNWYHKTVGVGFAGVDMREVVIYEHDGNLWTRPVEEFNDGRFEALPTPQPVEGPREPVAWLRHGKFRWFYRETQPPKDEAGWFPLFDEVTPPSPAQGTDDPACTCCGGTGITYQTERRCACQPATSQGTVERAEADDWRDDPSADERWNAGLGYGQEQLCAYLGVDPNKVTWDAATETLDGDVQAVIGNIFRAKFGEDFSLASPPVDSAPLKARIAQMEEALRALLDCPDIADNDFKDEETQAAERIARVALSSQGSGSDE